MKNKGYVQTSTTLLLESEVNDNICLHIKGCFYPTQTQPQMSFVFVCYKSNLPKCFKIPALALGQLQDCPSEAAGQQVPAGLWYHIMPVSDVPRLLIIWQLQNQYRKCQDYIYENESTRLLSKNKALFETWKKVNENKVISYWKIYVET